MTPKAFTLDDVVDEFVSFLSRISTRHNELSPSQREMVRKLFKRGDISRAERLVEQVLDEEGEDGN